MEIESLRKFSEGFLFGFEWFKWLHDWEKSGFCWLVFFYCEMIRFWLDRSEVKEFSDCVVILFIDSVIFLEAAEI